MSAPLSICASLTTISRSSVRSDSQSSSRSEMALADDDASLAAANFRLVVDWETSEAAMPIITGSAAMRTPSVRRTSRRRRGFVRCVVALMGRVGVLVVAPGRRDVAGRRATCCFGPSAGAPP
jgi:hypothetical protein